MYKEIEEFMEAAAEHRSLCPKYDRKIKSANSRIELFKTVLDVQPLAVICESVKNRWGDAVGIINKLFPDFINGKVTRDGNYSSSLYVGYKGKIENHTTLICVIDSDVELEFEDYEYATILVAGNSKLHSVGGNTEVEAYGENSILKGDMKITFI